MKIGIIGAGQIGATLAGKFSELGHQVSLANSRGPETIATVAEQSGATAVSLENIGKGADLIIVSIPQGNVSTLPQAIFQNLDEEVIVIDTGNYYPGMRDARIEPIEHGLPESGWVEQQIGRPVVKAFSNILADSLAREGRGKGAAGRIALAVAGDDARAKQIVMELVDAVGFDSVDAGSIEESWCFQPGSPAYCTNLTAPELNAALKRAHRRKLPENRDRALQMVGKLPAAFTTRDVIEINRSL